MHNLLRGSIFKTIVQLVAVTTVLSACDKQIQFSSKALQSAGGPGVECTPDDPGLSYPTVVQLDQEFNMAFQRDRNVVWTLKQGLTTITLEGSPVSTSLHSIGDYIGSVTGVDNCGNSDLQEFTIHVVEPIKGLSITINNNDLYTKTQNVTVALSAVGATQMYVTNDPQCASGGSWEAVASTKAWVLGDRNQLTRVFVKFKNTDIETPCVSDDITEDDIAPVPTFVTTPPVLQNTRTATFDFAATDNLSGVNNIYCKIDQAAFEICGTHKVFANLTDGVHTVSIYADDKAGNSSAVDTRSFGVDTIAPTVQITQHPDDPTNQKNAHFEFIGNDNGQPITYFECSVDGAPYAQCNSPKEYQNLADGRHTFKVRGRDDALNFSADASFSWTIDAHGPTVIITQKPVDPSKEHDSNFAFTVTDSGVGVQSVKCQIDAAALVDCTSPISYNLPNGPHTFKVVATDRVNNSGSASYTWTINDKINDQIIPITDSNGKADILFVVDDSSSMFTVLSESFPYRFRNFISGLASTDYKIAVTTADATGDRDFQSGRLAKILSSPVPGSGVPLVPAQYSLIPSSPHVSEYMQATVMRPEAICVSTGTHLCPNPAHNYQEAIHASLEALQRPESVSQLRDDATLNLIIISDTDEGLGNLVDSHGNILPNTPDYNRPQTLVNYVHQRWPQKQFKVHGVYRSPSDTGCNNPNIETRKAYIYDSLVQMTGGIHANICHDGNRTEIDAMAQAIQRAPSVFQLSCAPVDTNGDGRPDVTATYDPQPSYPIDVVVTGNTVTFNPMPPAGTSVHLRYTCP